jgi:hypothetical protein
MLWVCGLCHDGIHEWIGYLLGESRKPNPYAPQSLFAQEAAWAVRMYKEALEEWHKEALGEN